MSLPFLLAFNSEKCLFCKNVLIFQPGLSSYIASQLRNRSSGRKPARQQQSRELMEQTQESKSASILVIDDNLEMAEFIRLAIEDLGHTVIERHDGTSGLQAFRDAPNSIDLVLLDVAMPDINGIHILEEIRGLSPGVPVIFVSGFVQGKAEALALGANDVLPKPFSMRDLENAVKAALKASGKTG